MKRQPSVPDSVGGSVEEKTLSDKKNAWVKPSRIDSLIESVRTRSGFRTRLDGAPSSPASSYGYVAPIVYTVLDGGTAFATGVNTYDGGTPAATGSDIIDGGMFS